MKSLMYSTMFALAIATTGLPTVAQSQEVNYDPSAPRIVSTDIDRSDTAHEITLYTGSHGPLSYVTLLPPDYLRVGDDIEVKTESGRKIEAKVFRAADNNLLLLFARPIPPKTTLEIVMQDVNPLYPGARSYFNYRVYGGHVGLEQPLSYGLARFKANNT